jgi:hypothetical protein
LESLSDVPLLWLSIFSDDVQIWSACEAHLGYGSFDLAVDLGTEKQHEAGDVKP